MKQPSISDFTDKVTSKYVTVFFIPYKSEIVFPVLPDGSLGPPNFRHAKTGDTGEYSEHEVLAMAQRLAEEALARSRRG